MLELGSLAFTQPWILAALAGLPVLYRLLRVTPPSPRRQRFPPIGLLLGLRPPEETPARTPWWLLLLRLAIAALIVVGLSDPLLNPASRLTGTGPLILVIDDDWASAGQWEARRRLADDLLTQAERQNRPVVVLPTAPAANDAPATASGLLVAGDARGLVRALEPKPWPADRAAALAALDGLEIEGSAHVVWLSNGLDDAPVGGVTVGGTAGETSVASLTRRLRTLGRLDLVRDADTAMPKLLLPPVAEGLGLEVTALRARPRGEETVTLLATEDDGRLVTSARLIFAEGARDATVTLDLPVELRNRIAELRLEGSNHPGAAQLLDERWRRRPVGLVAGGSGSETQPLLSELYYLERALQPFSELRRGEIAGLLEQETAVLALADVGTVPEAEAARVSAWIETGGVLLRFAGPRLAEGAGDGLLPVVPRGGGRTLGGVLTWGNPARLAPFDPHGPFAGLRVPEDVLIERQVLAEPSLDLGDKTWARLTDGTPLVTAERRGEGWIVLVHTTANTDWSNLVLSGLFVDMLRRIAMVSQGVSGDGEAEADLPPVRTMNGFGRLGTPAATTLAISSQDLAEGLIGPRHPPGYYGSGGARRALNFPSQDLSLVPIGDPPAGVGDGRYGGGGGETSLGPWLLAAALVLLLLDLLVSLALRGPLGRGVGPIAAAALAGPYLALVIVGDARPVLARTLSDNAADRAALAATLATHLAYVKTGVPSIDDVTRTGLLGLTRLLERRTSVEPGAPVGVELGRDEIAFFPLLYWPVTPEQRSLDSAARDKVNEFLANGGSIFFDLREPSAGIQLFGRPSRNSEALRRLTEGLGIPPLMPVPPDHVVTKSFYLMRDFPGRFAGGTLWVGASDDQVNDGVASIIVGSNDYAGAWAVDPRGRPRHAVVPGGGRQREMAFRVGVNVVMYALTGNYKADQVHVPFILERLGR